MIAQTTAPTKQYSTPFWVQGTYKAKVGISGFVSGKPYFFNAKTKQISKRVGSDWIVMDDAELAALPIYVKETLTREYYRIFSMHERFDRRDYRKRQYLTAVKAWNH